MNHAPTTHPGDTQRGQKILVVEDDADIRQILSVFLKHSGFEVRTVSDGQQAINAIPEFCPSLIVLDLMMQPVSGWEVLRWLRTIYEASPGENETLSKQLHTIPVLILTALTEIEVQVDGFEAGAVEYMTKPTQPAKIVDRILNLLSLSPEQRSMLQRKRFEDQRSILERIRTPLPDEFLY